MTHRIVSITFVLMAAAGPAWACKAQNVTPAAAVERADVIVRARVLGLASTPGKAGTVASSAHQVRFGRLEVMKGTLASTMFEFNGELGLQDDRNNQPVPYPLVRPNGRSGSCFAMQYRVGGEYLLFLGRGHHASYAQPDTLTPYWAPLAPTNEQLFGGTGDPWYRWVAQRVPKRDKRGSNLRCTRRRAACRRG